MNKHYYAGHSYMGTNFTYDSPCWVAYRFDSKAERDKFVNENEYNEQGNKVKEAISRKIAFKIAEIGPNQKPETDYDGRLIAVWK